MVVVGVDSDWVENGEEGLVEEHFVIDEVRQPYWQHFVQETQYELDLVQIEIDELELAHELVVHQNLPSENKHTKTK